MIFLLTHRQILDTYCIILSALSLLVSYEFNTVYILQELAASFYLEDMFDIVRSHPFRHVIYASVQISLAYLYNSLRFDLFKVPHGTISKYVFGSFRKITFVCALMPMICRLLAFPPKYLKSIPAVCVLFMATEFQILLITQLQSVIQAFKRAYMTTRYMLRTYGVQTFVEMQWVRLHVPSALRVFWITRFTYQVIKFLIEKSAENIQQSGGNIEDYVVPISLSVSDVYLIVQDVLISGCETVIALLGMTSIVSYITHYVGLGFASYIGTDNEEDRNMGTMSAILFFILALQTGLTGMDPEKRLVRLYRNFCLLSTAILHFVHSMVHPQLMNISASRNLSTVKHGRALSMCLFLVGFPCWFLTYLWAHHDISTWLLAVTAFSVEVIVKVFTSLLVYTLFMIDAYREQFWEKLDDYVYYIKSTGNTIEFLFGLFLFCNGAWIMIFESGGTIRAVMMCIHAYFNIWVQAKEGWKVFMKRRTAVNKINSLPLATEEQLNQHNDVCAICYQDLLSARMTQCNHYFHGVCLRKWLYVQDRCPLCHEFIYREAAQAHQQTNANNNEEPNARERNGNAVHEHND